LQLSNMPMRFARTVSNLGASSLDRLSMAPVGT
jgi:hypothetical protein